MNTYALYHTLVYKILWCWPADGYLDWKMWSYLNKICLFDRNVLKEDKPQTARWNTNTSWLLCPRHSPLSSAKVKNEWSYTYTPLTQIHSTYRDIFNLKVLTFTSFLCSTIPLLTFIMINVIALICILITNYITISRKSSISLMQSYNLLCHTKKN